MFKQFFNCINLNLKIKKQTEALKTLEADTTLLQELMEHPIKTQKQIVRILGDMKDICEKVLNI